MGLSPYIGEMMNNFITDNINTIINGDCLDVMKKLPDKSIDMILCDLPYGTTACKWDVIIPFEPLWEQYKRIIKDNGAIVLTASQPFTSALVMSNIKGFKHHWLWEKEKGTGFQIAKYRPMMKTEDIIVFTSKGETVNYYPIKEKRHNLIKSSGASSYRGSSPICNISKQQYVYEDKYPENIIKISRDSDKEHPTQKPVKLWEYLIKTYSKDNQFVLDNCSGSGTTAIACHNLNRNFICIEKDIDYYKASVERLNNAKAQMRLF